MADTLYIVVPCYNEEEVLPETATRLEAKMAFLQQQNRISPHSRVLLVDDGSQDATWLLIQQLHRRSPVFSGLKLARNKGHQNALLAGLMTARHKADMVISMDADLQDDIDAVDAMVEQYYQGCQVVYGVRRDRTTDTAFKRSTAQGFYRLMGFLGVNIVYNHADYRLMSRTALEGLAAYQEVNLFLRGIVPQIGYKTGTVEYDRGERFAGESKYPLKKMLSFAWDGVTSFSVRPLRLISLVGAVLMALSLVIGLAGNFTKLGLVTFFAVCSHPILVAIGLMGGLQLVALGLVGEYVGKLYAETKSRPKYLIETVLDTGGDPPAQGAQ